MQHQEYEPPEELRDTIECFWYNRRDSEEIQSSFEVTPDGYAEIIFHFGGDCSIAEIGVLKPLPSPFLMGLLNKPAIFSTKGRFEIIGIRCFPWTVFDLLGLTADNGGLRLFEHSIALLQDALGELIYAGNIDEAIKQVKQYFLNSRSRVTTDSMLFKAGAAMRQAKGTIPVSHVAAAAHATVRTLERNFKQSSGHTVKDVSALMRFEQVRNKLWLNPGVSLSALAVELGYTDQSHLSREFKRYSGTTPAAFARNSKKGKKILFENFVAFVQA